MQIAGIVGTNGHRILENLAFFRQLITGVTGEYVMGLDNLAQFVEGKLILALKARH